MKRTLLILALAALVGGCGEKPEKEKVHWADSTWSFIPGSAEDPRARTCAIRGHVYDPAHVAHSVEERAALWDCPDSSFLVIQSGFEEECWRCGASYFVSCGEETRTIWRKVPLPKAPVSDLPMWGDSACVNGHWGRMRVDSAWAANWRKK